LCEKYYWISPYAYCAGNPVNRIDPDGQDITISYIDKDNKEQKWVFNGKNGENAPKNDFVNSFIGAYNYNLENGGGEKMKEAATNSELNIPLQQGDETVFYHNTEKGTYGIDWNPKDGIKTDEGYKMSPATALDHEFDHATSYVDNPTAYDKRANTPDKQYDNKEERRVITGSEVRTARANYEYPQGYVRKNHSGGSFITVPNPTSNGDRLPGIYRWINRHAKQNGNNTIYKRMR